ncbi:MAG: DUF4445 domain-containing protein [Deltaproteobacteria bacterium]|nr:DUF4445 domain-containing protein [Deltaproteobacteria bacterium]
METTDREEGWIRTVPLKLVPPSLQDNRADAERLLRGLEKTLGGGGACMDLSTMRRTPSLLRQFGYEGKAVVFEDGGRWRLIDLFAAGRRLPPCGIAVDLGSSTLVLRLLDLSTGEGKDEIAFLNPQNAIGPDILTRIHYASQTGGLEDLRSRLLQEMNRQIGNLTKRNGLAPGDILGMCVAGNTTMTHLFLGLDPSWLCREPYIPAVNSPGILRAKDLDLAVHPEAPVLVLPNVGSYFGGDLIAGILASGMAEQEEVSILVDVGTNAEVVLGNREWLMACAGAAGPALEGGVAGMGMMAAPGVIDRVRIEPGSGKLEFRTIEDRPPVGICGSGLIDLVSQLFLAGMIDLRGKFVATRCKERLREIEGIPHFRVVSARDSGTGRDLTLGQTDIDALIRSKAAMYTILVTVTGMVNLSLDDIGRFYIAGTFGSYIDPRSAVSLGMIPDLPLARYRPLGNSSLAGASRVLLSSAAREATALVRDRITYVELNVNQEFMNRFSAAKFIPHTDRSLFPSVGEGMGD